MTHPIPNLHAESINLFLKSPVANFTRETALFLKKTASNSCHSVKNFAFTHKTPFSLLVAGGGLLAGLVVRRVLFQDSGIACIEHAKILTGLTRWKYNSNTKKYTAKLHHDSNPYKPIGKIPKFFWSLSSDYTVDVNISQIKDQKDKEKLKSINSDWQGPVFFLTDRGRGSHLLIPDTVENKKRFTEIEDWAPPEKLNHW